MNNLGCKSFQNSDSLFRFIWRCWILHLKQHYEFFCGILIVTVLTSVYSWMPYSPLDKREPRAIFMLMLFIWVMSWMGFLVVLCNWPDVWQVYWTYSEDICAARLLLEAFQKATAAVSWEKWGRKQFHFCAKE